jgi:hypothetical protein
MSEYVLARLQALQQELEELRKAMLYETQGPKRKIKLKGLWKGVHVTEEDVHEARRAVFKEAYKSDE